MKVGFDIQFALTRTRTGLFNMTTGLVGGVRALTPTPPVLLFCQRASRPYGAEDVSWASAAFGGLPVLMERPPRVLYRVWQAWAAHNRVDVLVHNLHGVIPPSSRTANVFVVPDLIPLTMNAAHAGYADECRHFYQRAVARGAAVVVIAEHTRRELVATFGADPARVHVVHLAAAPEYRPLTLSERRSALPPELLDRPYVLCVSTLEPRKNHAVLIRAFARLLGQCPTLPHDLVLVGGIQDGFTAPLQLARELGIEHRVRHLGFVDSLAAVYSGADLMVFPSLSEGFGLPPLEAMSCGVPVVCSNATSLPEVMGDAGLMFEPTDERALAEQMRAVLTDPGLAESMRQGSLRQAAQFSWSKTAAQFYGVLASAAAGGARRRSSATPAYAAGPHGVAGKASHP
jgi:glycosyltransferase involved in cell wall biosynthesis